MVLKKEYLDKEIQHLDIRSFDSTPIINSYADMAFQARNLARAAQIYDLMLQNKECTVILCLAGSLVSAGLKNIVLDLLKNNMIDVIVSTGANIVDQDFFEALGYKHYQGDTRADDQLLRSMSIDRIYDTYINEDDLRECDHTIYDIANQIPAGLYSSREFISLMGEFLVEHDLGKDSIVRNAYEKSVPIFVPAFADCSAGFGLVLHQIKNPELYVAIDSVRDFKELTEIKIKSKDTGILMLGGGVPKNFTQDIVVAAELLGHDVPMHKYAVQLSVADERDGALSGSTLKEACSWGKVDTTFEQMVFSEYTISFPLLASYAYHQNNWRDRIDKKLNDLF